MSLAQDSTAFLDYLEAWMTDRPTLKIDDAITTPAQTALISVDVINGFLYEGPLASPRVAAIDRPVTGLMQAAWDRGVRDIVLLQEGHSPDSLEFSAFGPHAVRGSEEAEAIPLIKALPFYSSLTTLYKDSIHPALNTGLEDWLNARPDLKTIIAVGDVTDLCTYQLATYLKLHANAFHQERRVIVPVNCTQTWHLSVEDAAGGPVMPHQGDLLHTLFLYHMALNGVEVVREMVS